MSDVSGDPPRVVSVVATWRSSCTTSRPTAFTLQPKARWARPRAAWCLRNRFPFTTSYHTQFPEYVRARAPIPLRDQLRALCGASIRPPRARMPVDADACRSSWKTEVFATSCAGQRGVDVRLLPKPGDKEFLQLPRADLRVPGPRRGREEHRSVPGARPAGHQAGRSAMDLERLRVAGASFRRRCSSATSSARSSRRISALSMMFTFPSRTDTFGLGAARSTRVRCAGRGVSGDGTD